MRSCQYLLGKGLCPFPPWRGKVRIEGKGTGSPPHLCPPPPGGEVGKHALPTISILILSWRLCPARGGTLPLGEGYERGGFHARYRRDSI
jgi:hypothetical protein